MKKLLEINKRKLMVTITALFMLIVSATAFATTYTTAYSTTYNGQIAVRYELNIDSSRKLVSINYGGSRSWRNNNPGNLKYGSFASSNGAIGTDGQFAIFPNYDTGYNAKKTLITTTYRDYTIEAMMNKYAPPSENDTAAYIRYIVSKTGMPASTYIRDMNSSQLNSLLDAMKQYEGFVVGSTTTFVEG
ncbi:MAG TPA: hypothetical protein VIO64_02540 [Pseudobacteroides sp.]|uniref:hypothetical protein n=1 Tax=Pseudobacteroides sp. TaxID=1968840 RepID=UPI002F94305D